MALHTHRKALLRQHVRDRRAVAGAWLLLGAALLLAVLALARSLG